jgi:hypothetical protein
MSKSTGTSLTGRDAVFFLENILLRERLDLKSWDTLHMRANMLTMKEIVTKASWDEKETSASEELLERIEKLLLVIQNKDATLVDAAHTHLEDAVNVLRKLIFGF